MKDIKNILEKYKGNSQIFTDTIDMLCKKGIANGCYQDYSVLIDILGVLSICEKIIKGEE